MEFIKKDISAGIELVGIPVDRFKTNLITVSLALPLERESVSANAVMLGLLARRGAKYRDMLSLNRKLASLYGATLNETVSKSANAKCYHSVLLALMTDFHLTVKAFHLNV